MRGGGGVWVEENEDVWGLEGGWKVGSWVTSLPTPTDAAAADCGPQCCSMCAHSILFSCTVSQWLQGEGVRRMKYLCGLLQSGGSDTFVRRPTLCTGMCQAIEAQVHRHGGDAVGRAALHTLPPHPSPGEITCQAPEADQEAVMIDTIETLAVLRKVGCVWCFPSLGSPPDELLAHVSCGCAARCMVVWQGVWVWVWVCCVSVCICVGVHARVTCV
jgi:hypothetical protein